MSENKFANEYRLFGPPGTGKTTSIEKKVHRDLQSYSGDQIMLCSFTKSAAFELISRGLPVPKANVGTIHSICYRMIGDVRVANIKISEFNDFQKKYQISASTEGNLDNPIGSAGTETEGDILLAELGRLRNKLVPIDEWGDEVNAFNVEYSAWKQEAGYLDFTDLLKIGLLEIDCPSGIRQIYVDESQDLTPLQLAIVRKWSKNLDQLILCGDDDQALYEWVGADPAVLTAPGIDPSHVGVLSQSYRVPEAVHGLAMQVAERIPNRQPKVYKPRTGDPGQLNYDDSISLYKPDNLLNYIDQDLKDGNSCMILTTANYQLNKVVKALRERGYPFHNPYRRSNGMWNPLQTKRGPVSSIERLWRFSNESRGNMTWKHLKSILDIVKGECLQRGAKTSLDKVCKEKPDSQANWMDVQGLLRPECHAPFMNADSEWFLSNLVDSKAGSMEYPASILRNVGSERLLDQPRIVIGTIHSVKGGESDSVYLFPELSKRGKYELDTGNVAPILRMLYVGITRAKKQLTICGKSDIL